MHCEATLVPVVQKSVPSSSESGVTYLLTGQRSERAECKEGHNEHAFAREFRIPRLMPRISVILLALCLGGGGVLEAQNRQGQLRAGPPAPQPGAQQNGQRAPDEGPVPLLLQHRELLGLTPRQVSRLESIDAEMERENQPLVVQLSDIRGKIRSLGSPETMTVENRSLYESYMSQARPLMRRIQENNWEAMRSVGRVLTEEQKNRMAQLLRDRESKSRGPDNNRERSGRSSQLPSRGI
jgi:hypothetical protein